MVPVTSVQRMEAYVEVIEILKYMDEQYVRKIPEQLINFFRKHCSSEYQFSLDETRPLEEQNLKSKTLDILAMLNVNYWCESEEHKQELLKQYEENQKRRDEQIRRENNPDELFQTKVQEIKAQIVKVQEETKSEEVALVDLNSFKWYQKIGTNIRNWFLKVFKSN